MLRKMDHPPWLPLGWTAEVKVVKKGPSSGTTYKCYTELATGKKLYSKPKVLAYLNETNKQNNGDNSNNQPLPETTKVQPLPDLPPALTEAEWRSIAEIYYSAVPGYERFPLPSRDEGSSTLTQQNTNSNPTLQAWEATAMEGDQQVEVGNDQLIIISTSAETDDLMDEMLSATSNNQSDHGTGNNESKPEQEAAAAADGEAEQEDTESKSLAASLHGSSKRHAEIETILLDYTLPRKTGPRSVRQRSNLYATSLEVPEMDIDKVEGKQTVENVDGQCNELDGGVPPPPPPPPPPPLTFHQEMLSQNCIQFALNVLGFEYEVINEPGGWQTAKQFYEGPMWDPFLEYACENWPDPSEILPPSGYDNNNNIQELDQSNRDVQRCKQLPNFGFPMSFDSDVPVHFQTPTQKGNYQFGNGAPQLGSTSSGDQSKNGK